MNNRIIDDFPLCNEMMEDLSNKYQVDTFWKNYESMNVSLIKHYGLKTKLINDILDNTQINSLSDKNTRT